MSNRSARLPRRGFSLVEALVSVTITTVAGGALLAAVGSAVQSSTDVTQRAVARGLAQQLMDEIAGVRFPTASGPVPTKPAREDFDDIDDYSGWTSRPPVRRDGVQLGTEGHVVNGDEVPRLNALRPDERFIRRFTRQVAVEPVEPDGNGGWTPAAPTSQHRRVTVAVSFTDATDTTRILAEITRVFSFVPPGL